MRTKIKNIISILANNKALIVVLLIVAVFTINNQIQANNQIEAVKQELLKAQQPSEIEIQKAELDKLELDWQTKQAKIEELREQANTIEQEKFELEPKIRAKRNEILWIVK